MTSILGQAFLGVGWLPSEAWFCKAYPVYRTKTDGSGICSRKL